ncbi:signal recognition particle-docking protein FtsY [Enterococcus saccharolyticus]|uniref:Signal recognition particle receptor FtsY n=1 Tax=Enterococcus saccharolyticus subsp. saccharolyticus ATCC 43076 TaxID=1139996 RepID=S0JF01_9ENTE|nr:signal recognition particle-docking protein FtsY [Enterococcus saccharolyticus]EOT25606.1 signal recognition particle-docking protein FtsY [Enterococcus saccharolyticus subsp. saccharolyticus ATCC 43076]EOT83284.1 signal recognition particle-docking protein FtsY [Enterococcus saccharolyticus subsp. saccharolyticus ATCC 43076]OJG90627.1 signal recognition particle-docking protein FtsY [Enterococcus saccharolyticus]
MGLFDKIKSAFIRDKQKEQEVEELETEEVVEEEPIDVVDETTIEVTTEETEAIEEVEEISEVMPEVDIVEATIEESQAIEEVAEVELEPIVASEPTPEPVATQEKYDKGLAKTRKTFKQRMNELFANFRSVDEDFFEEVEETLISADVGFETSMRIADELRQEVKLRNAKKPGAVQNAIIEKLVDLYEEEGLNEVNELNLQPNGLSVFLFVGVNGVGKTTSIGKLANQYREQGKKVLLAAADTFRAGAIDQLVVWGERAQVEVVRGKAGGDPAAVVFDAMQRAKEENADVLLVDTAGRLQNKVNLMNELDKIKRIIQRVDPEAPHEVLLVLDATTGQNAMTQAKQFKETTDVTGLVLTKLDGTAKGGIVLAIRNELHLPVKLVGLGEGIDDLEPFNPNDFVVGLFKELLQEEY